MALSDSQKGRIVEQLVGATLMAQSDGVLRVCVPLVDDEGVDLVVVNRTNEKSMLLQVKGRFSLTGRGRYRHDVRRNTCAPIRSKSIVFLYYDRAAAALGETCWLIPSTEFCKRASNQREDRPVYVFDSTFDARSDMWQPFRLPLKELAAKILQSLK